MRAKLFELNYKALENIENLNSEVYLFIMDNILRFEFLISYRLKEKLSSEIKAGYEEGIESLKWAEKFLIDILSQKIIVSENLENYKYLIYTLHKGMAELFKNEIINECSFKNWLEMRVK